MNILNLPDERFNMNKRIIVTGASRGIGRAISLLLAKEGYDLLIVSRSEEALTELKKEIENKYDVDVIKFAADLKNTKEVSLLSEKINKLNDIYALINNAGISHVGLLQDMTYEEWNNIVDVNLSSVFYMSKAVIPQMVSRKEGRIINISSMWGNAGASMEVAYSATKGGVNAFTKALAKELAPSNIVVNAIAYGVIATSMNSHLSEDEMNDLKNDIPMGRIADPAEAAQMVVNVLCAPSYMTGQIIAMDGGYI